jgi:glucosamine-6-phosphate deaminase
VRVEILDDAAAIGEALATDIIARLKEAATEGCGLVLGCPTGRSPRPVYQALGRRLQQASLDLRRLTLVMMDEFVAPSSGGFDWIDDRAHNSCRRYARDEIAAVLNAGLPAEWRLPEDQIWFPDPSAPDGAYDERIASAGGIDLFILASGAGDGHVAFNPPGSPVDSRTRIVALAEQTRRDNLASFPDFPGLEAVPHHGVTVGIATIARLSRAATMVLCGPGKRVAFSRIAGASSYDPSWPATVLSICSEAVLLADRAAATP